MERNQRELQIEEEPYGQLALFEGLNSQGLAPLAKYGGAKTQNARAGDVARTNSSHRLPASAYNPFFSPAIQQQMADCDLQRPFTTLHALDLEAATGSAHKLLNHRGLQEDRPATVTHKYDIDESFRLPPLDKGSSRGPLYMKGSVEKIRSRRSKDQDEEEPSASEVSKMVKLFEPEGQRVRERKVKQKEGSLAKRCKL
jgi:hypothetical protein